MALLVLIPLRGMSWFHKAACTHSLKHLPTQPPGALHFLWALSSFPPLHSDLPAGPPSSCGAVAFIHWDKWCQFLGLHLLLPFLWSTGQVSEGPRGPSHPSSCDSAVRYLSPVVCTTSGHTAHWLLLFCGVSAHHPSLVCGIWVRAFEGLPSC